MPDRYIDHDETEIYGAYAADKIRSRVKGVIVEFDDALEYVAAEISEATQAVQGAVADARAADAEIRKGSKARGSVLKQAMSLLGRFSKHLDTHAPGTIDRKTFFVADGTAGGVGKGVPRVLRALQHIGKQLKAEGSPVKNAAEWAKECADLAAKLAPIAEHGDNARTDRSSVTPEIETARQAWLQTYGAAKLTVEAVLRLSGKLHLMPLVFFDLAVPSNAKVTSAPSGEVDEPEAEEPEAGAEDAPAGGTKAKPS
jgi:hypothetical protein